MDPQTGRFSKPLGPKTPNVDVLATAWTLVDSADANSTAVFTGGAFSLRPGQHPPVFTESISTTTPIFRVVERLSSKLPERESMELQV